MASNAQFGDTVAARTRTAEFIRSTPELLEAYLALGGLARDLEAIASAGHKAEAANLAQSGRLANGMAATLDVAHAFAALQREYKAVMAVVRAVLHDLQSNDGTSAALSALEKVLADETAVVVSVTTKDDKSVRKRHRSEAQEAVRAEIRKDAAALLEIPEAAEALATRKVDGARLTKLRDDADALSGQVAARVARKAERKDATADEGAAVREQRRVWGACYRLLSAMPDPRVRALLATARR